MQPKKQMSGLDIAAIAAEMQQIVRGKIEKIYQIGEKLRIRFYTAAVGKRDIMIDPNGKIYITENPPTAPKYPTGMAMLLRKYLTGGAILSVSQYKFDRILNIEVGRGGKRYNLLTELFSGGNVLLLNEDRLVIGSKENVIQGNKKISTGEAYTFPEVDFDPSDFSLLERDVKDILLNSDKNLSETIAVKLGFGRIYAEEICVRAKLNRKSRIEELSEEETENICFEVKKILSDVLLGEGNLKPNIVYSSGDSSKKAIGFFPVDLEIFKEEEKEYLKTFSGAADKYFKGEIERERVEEKGEKGKKDREKSKFERILERQGAAIEEYRRKMETNKELGDMIYAEYPPIEEILKTLNDARKRYSFGEIKEILRRGREKGIKTVEKIKSINEREKKIIFDLNGREIELSLEKNVFENAEIYYEKSKKFKKKINGALRSREKISEEMRRYKKEAEKKKKTTFKLKRRWYHKFRWFFSSNGFLVIAGRDADSNEEVVNKYMEKNDLFFHADISGAPATVIKTNKKEIPELTLEEAAKFAVSYSNYWKMGAYAGDCYWVYPEQVSKTPESGEYLSKGGFIIRGSRNYLKDVPADVCIGISVEDGIIGGPTSAIAGRCKYFVELEPGPFSQNDIAKKIYRHFIEIRERDEEIERDMISQEKIIHFAPPGTSRIK
ncbi:MAG: fibronectin-binding domain-containing protein [Candidatus Methanolliviera hydrocarbonicum]|uniref:Fibronectin-binding domain-containing protein n=1 Tax=Candidatus Methanolliviera hydrocarbonicum TaxID=2491085 RepID=A0A520KVF6_9EURY|nr:MAG: fibronectin-binding domain-containing protein [Candidatus Methanolliviera hydrocarbonicum]